MSVDHRAENRNCCHRVDGTLVPVRWLTSEEGNKVTDHTPSRENQDVNLGMSEDPEEMLEQDWVTRVGAHTRRPCNKELGSSHSI